MELTKGTYEIRRKEFLDGIVETITISKEEMEALKAQYMAQGRATLAQPNGREKCALLQGKIDFISDLLEYFKDEPHKGIND